MQGVPNTKNIKKDPETGEFIVYCIIRGDNYDLSRHKNLLQAIRERDKIISNGGFELAVGYRLKHHGKHYYKRGDKYIVTRVVDGKAQHYGTYETESEAKAMVRKLWKYNWDKEKLPDDLKKIIRRTPKYYTLSNGKYQISKKIGDKQVSFGAYDTEAEAKEMVQELKKVNWDINQLPYMLKRRIIKKHKYYTLNKKNNQYYVTKDHVYYGHYATESEAMEIVSMLKSVDWNMDKLTPEQYQLLSISQPKEYKNYTYNNRTGKYVVYHAIDGKSKKYGNYNTEAEAIKAVSILKKVDWDTTKLTPEDKKKLNLYKPKHYGYNKRTGKWRVYKQINGKHTSFGEYGSEVAAKRIVEKLIANNWNKECLQNA